jgi:hypothetical protein
MHRLSSIRAGTGDSARSLLERALWTVTEQAEAANRLVNKAIDTGLGGSHPVTVQAKTFG